MGAMGCRSRNRHTVRNRHGRPSPTQPPCTGAYLSTRRQQTPPASRDHSWGVRVEPSTRPDALGTLTTPCTLHSLQLSPSGTGARRQACVVQSAIITIIAGRSDVDDGLATTRRADPVTAGAIKVAAATAVASPILLRLHAQAIDCLYGLRTRRVLRRSGTRLRHRIRHATRILQGVVFIRWTRKAPHRKHAQSEDNQMHSGACREHGPLHQRRETQRP